MIYLKNFCFANLDFLSKSQLDIVLLKARILFVFNRKTHTDFDTDIFILRYIDHRHIYDKDRQISFLG